MCGPLEVSYKPLTRVAPRRTRRDARLMTRSSRMAGLCTGAVLALSAIAVTVPAQAAVPTGYGTLPACPTTPGVTFGGSDPHQWSIPNQQPAMPQPTCTTPGAPPPTYTSPTRRMTPPVKRTTAMPVPTTAAPTTSAPGTGLPAAPPTAPGTTAAAPVGAPVNTGSTTRLPVTGIAIGGILIIGGALLSTTILDAGGPATPPHPPRPWLSGLRRLGAARLHGASHGVRDGVQAQRLADHLRRPVVRLPAGRTGPVQVAQVVEALIGTPALHATRVVEDGVPVHVLVGAEVTGGPVLEPRVLPSRHAVMMADH